MRNELGAHSFEFWVLRQGRGSDLNQDDLASPLWVSLQELFKRLELVVDSLCDIELLSTDDNLLVLVQHLERLHLGEDTWRISVMRDTFDVDTNGTVADSGELALGLDTAIGRFETAYTNTGRDKVSRVGVGLEHDNVGSEHSLEDFPSS